jgi:processive 1,2-diacylglycerol beta-glucosyltransferase
MITLTLKDNGRFLGTIEDNDLQFLIEQLEEESDTDNDYYVDAVTIDLLADKGASASLLAILREAVGNSEGAEVSWTRA